jgi:hypothetical protein
VSKGYELLPSQGLTRYAYYCTTVATVSVLFTMTHIENCPVIFQLMENASLGMDIDRDEALLEGFVRMY